MMEPPPSLVALACEFARKSPCVKSKRGVVIFEPTAMGAGIVHGTGFNGPPEPFFCDKSAACRKDCGVVCMHAEMRALLGVSRAVGHQYKDAQLLAGEPITPLQTLHLIHVKVDDTGQLVAGKAPCCELCSRMILDVGIDTVWLYEAAVIEHGVLIHQHGWRAYTAAEFHRRTLETLKFHVSKLETVHRFYAQNRSRYCAACGEEDYHPVHKL